MVYQLKVIFNSKNIEEYQEFTNFTKVISDLNEEEGVNTYNVESLDIADMDQEDIEHLEDEYDPINGPKTIIEKDDDFWIHEFIPSSEDDLMNMIEENTTESDEFEDDEDDYR
ncbi:MAG: hypothetical protein ACK4NC_02680 [Candidatus Gracilibacteria bacterium]